MKNSIIITIVAIIVLSLLNYLAFGFYNNIYVPSEWIKETKGGFLFIELVILMTSPLIGFMLNPDNEL